MENAAQPTVESPGAVPAGAGAGASKSNEPAPTPLLLLLRECDATQRKSLADWAGTSANYLYALAGGHRTSPRADLAFRIEDASRRLHKQTRGATRVVTAREIATQTAMRGLEG